MLVTLAQHGIAVLAVFICVGGIIGYKKAQSNASLIAGLGSAALLLAAYIFSFQSLMPALIAALVISFVLDGVFAVRLAKTKKFMPSGMLLSVNMIAQVMFILGIVFSMPAGG